MKLGANIRRIIREEMAAANGNASSVAASLADRYRVSVKRIYAVTADLRTGERKPRVDAGVNKIESVLTVDQINQLLAMSAKNIIAETVIEVAELSGIIPEGVITPSAWNRYLAASDCARKSLGQDVDYRARYRAKHANQIWQVDYTTAQQFYIDDDGTVKYESPLSVNKNRRGNQKRRMHCFAVYDQLSRLNYVEFTTGASTMYWLDVLYNAMRGRYDNYPMHGVPEIIGVDQDSVVKSRVFMNAMDRLGVNIWKHAPGHSYSKGVVESGFRKFQSREGISKLKAMHTLEEWNAFALDQMLHFAHKPHSAHGVQPIDAWLTSIRETPHALRAVPHEELYDTLHYQEHQRVVGNDLVISLDGAEIQLPERMPFLDMIRRKITFYTHPKRPEMISVLWDERQRTSDSPSARLYDVEKSAPRYYRPGEMPQVDYTGSRRRETLARAASAELPPLKTYGRYLDRHKNDRYLHREAAVFDEGRIDGKLTRTLDIEEAIMYLIQAGALPEEIEVHHRERVVAFFKDRNDDVTERDLDQLAAELKDGRRGDFNMRIVVNE